MTAIALYRHCRKAGIDLAIDGDGIAFDAPAGVEVPVDEIRRCKPELLAVLAGDYLHAAAALLDRIDRGRWPELIRLFDEGVTQFTDRGMDRLEAEHQAYLELCKNSLCGEVPLDQNVAESNADAFLRARTTNMSSTTPKRASGQKDADNGRSRGTGGAACS